MTPAFGFSVGDFISAINLIRKISKALKETGGASAEYQDAIIELKGLKHALQHLEALEPTEDNSKHVNAIRGMALACQLPLRDFMTKLEKYESSLGPWTDRTSLRKAGRKTKWAVSFGEEVKNLRALVAAKLISINLLLATYSSQAVSSMNSRSKKDHGDLMSKIVEHRVALNQVHGRVENIQDRMEGIEATSKAKLDAISSKSDATQLSVMSLRDLTGQALALVSTFSQEIRSLLYKIMQTDWRTYQAVLQIQESLSRSPSSMHDSDIRFTNALGEYRQLPYEYFCHWEPFEGFIRAQFKGKPGENKILEGQFHILDVNNRRAIVKKEHWSRSISQGATLTMSMVMSHLLAEPGHCPRPECTSASMRTCEVSGLLTCVICNLKFFPISNGLEDTLSKVIVSEDEIARQQVEEDLRLYGSRPEPVDAVDLDESTKLANLPPKRNASEFKAAIDRPAKAKGESQIFYYEPITAMDWNSGASPLDAWLNQSAVPSTAKNLVSSPSPENPEKSLTVQEEDEIKVFRNVHVPIAPSPKEDKAVDDLEGLDLGAQIYCRNIRDRYPLLTTYLTRRLAQANFKRYERLRSERLKMKQLVLEDAAQSQTYPENLVDAYGLDSLMAQKGVDLSLQNKTIEEKIPLMVDNEKRAHYIAAVARRRTQLQHRIISLETIKECSRAWGKYMQLTMKYLQEMKANCGKAFYCISPMWIPTQTYDNHDGRIKVSCNVKKYALRTVPWMPKESWRKSTAEALAAAEGKRETLSAYWSYRREWKKHKSVLTIEIFETQIQKLKDDLSETEDDIREMENDTEDDFDGMMNHIRDMELKDGEENKIHKLMEDIRIWENEISEMQENIREIADDVDMNRFSRRTMHFLACSVKDIFLNGRNRINETRSQTLSMLSKIADHDSIKHCEVEDSCHTLRTSSVLQEWPSTQTSGLGIYPSKHQSSSSNFWTRGTPSTSPSTESSMNSSLHGRPIFDPQEQNPTFQSDSQSRSAAGSVTQPALPRPPVELGKVKSFNCDICGKNIKVERRLEWQKHVMNDLRPYLCTFPDCPTAEETYASRSSVLNHEITVHELEGKSRHLTPAMESPLSIAKPVFENKVQENGIACIFCGEMLRKAMLDERARHVGRHMEEIAFSVVTKPYEEWEFYSDSSAKSNKDVHQTEQATDVPSRPWLA